MHTSADSTPCLYKQNYVCTFLQMIKAIEMKMVRTLVISLAVIAIMSINLAMAANNYTVGGPNGGWDQSTDLATWASSQTFVEGDNLIFQYTVNHDVTEVSKADFDSCTASNPLQPPYAGGLTIIPLTSAGSRYFICGSAGHCLGGMKVQIDAIAASAPPPSATPTAPAPPPKPSAGRPVPSPPTKNVAPSPSPKHSQRPTVETSPSPSATTPPPSGSSLPPPLSSAAKFDAMGAFVACFGLVLMMFLNL